MDVSPIKVPAIQIVHLLVWRPAPAVSQKQQLWQLPFDFRQISVLHVLTHLIWRLVELTL